MSSYSYHRQSARQARRVAICARMRAAKERRRLERMADHPVRQTIMQVAEVMIQRRVLADGQVLRADQPIRLVLSSAGRRQWMVAEDGQFWAAPAGGWQIGRALGRLLSC